MSEQRESKFVWDEGDVKTAKLCRCGSGKERYALHDARGIFCAYVCTKCEADKKRGYRPEIFTNGNYAADEPIEPEDY